MNQNNNIEKLTQFSAVSFENKNRSTPQTKLVVGLITKCIKETRPITQTDIIDIYVQWRAYNRWNKFYKKEYQGWSYQQANGGKGYLYTQISADEFKTLDNTKKLARVWFKSNLASAIIRGRLLVLPAIDIDDDAELPNRITESTSERGKERSVKNRNPTK